MLANRPVVLMNLRTTAVGQRAPLESASSRATTVSGAEAAPVGARPVRFEDGVASTPVHFREALPSGARLDGPCIVEQADTTVVIEPGMLGTVDGLGNIVIRRGDR
jgi:N-methylhydantoinase A